MPVHIPVLCLQVFLKMLESSASENAPQSFLITPKFLPNIMPENPKHLDIYYILNGAHAPSQDGYDVASQA